MGRKSKSANKSRNTPEYNASYYSEHKAEISQHRKDRYWKSDDYRKAVLRREREWREGKKRKLFEAAQAEIAATPNFDLSTCQHREIVVKLQGEAKLLVSPAAVAAALDVAPRTVAGWATDGLIPGPDFLTEANYPGAPLVRRWFTPDYVQRMYRLRPYLCLGRAAFFDAVKKEFKKEFVRDRVRESRDRAKERGA